MRCKKHFSDLSSTVGVCASCLRQRLFALIVAQAQLHQQAQAQEDQRKSDTVPAHLMFPRSVSPYISRRKSDTATLQRHLNASDQRFFSTPQVGPNRLQIPSSSPNKKKSKRFSLFSSLFRSKSVKSSSDRRDSASDRDPTSSSASPSWFSTMLSRKKQNEAFSLGETTVKGHRRSCRNRGMSPARHDDEEEGDEHYDSGYDTEEWKMTPRRTPARIAGRRHNRNVSGMSFCLSPLVRASPAPQEMVVSGELRVVQKPRLSAAASFCKNRSRKLADFGRFTHHH